MTTQRRTVHVDRLEGDFAVLTDGERHVDVPLAWLPPGVAEGWALTLTWSRDEAAEAGLWAEVEARQRRLGADDDGGDFSL